jgi:hypothetical protein
MAKPKTAPPRWSAQPEQARVSRPWWVLAVLVSGLLFGAGYLVGAPSSSQRQIDQLQQADLVRDKEQIVALTTLARSTRDEVAGWQRVVDAAVASFANPPSGMTATNVARGGLAAGVNELASAIRTYALGDSKDVRDVAARERTLAVTVWSVASTQLDQINIDAGYGHQHVFLPADPGSGAFTSDGAPEGTGGR